MCLQEKRARNARKDMWETYHSSISSTGRLGVPSSRHAVSKRAARSSCVMSRSVSGKHANKVFEDTFVFLTHTSGTISNDAKLPDSFDPASGSCFPLLHQL
jgi:hypothetical protein